MAQRQGIPGYSGEAVTEITALGVSTVLSCVSILSDSIAALPIKVYRELDDRNVTYKTPKFLKKPNLNQSRFDFIHQLVTSLALHGNAYVLIDRDTAERPVALSIIHPDKVKVNLQATGRAQILKRNKFKL